VRSFAASARSWLRLGGFGKCPGDVTVPRVRITTLCAARPKDARTSVRYAWGTVRGGSVDSHRDCEAVRRDSLAPSPLIAIALRLRHRHRSTEPLAERAVILRRLLLVHGCLEAFGSVEAWARIESPNRRTFMSVSFEPVVDRSSRVDQGGGHSSAPSSVTANGSPTCRPCPGRFRPRRGSSLRRAL
jgi:hypothetical protein